LTENTAITCSAQAFAGLSAEILGQGKCLRFQARGSSMQPLVRDGDILSVHPLEGNLPRVADIVLCRVPPGRILVHRVVRRWRDGQGWQYLLQGDRVAKPDGVFSRTQLLGRVMGIERSGRLFDTQHPQMKLLGWLVVVNSRWQLERLPGYTRLNRLLKRLPGFVSYFS
jgi:signal peptidase I